MRFNECREDESFEFEHDGKEYSVLEIEIGHNHAGPIYHWVLSTPESHILFATERWYETKDYAERFVAGEVRPWPWTLHEDGVYVTIANEREYVLDRTRNETWLFFDADDDSYIHEDETIGYVMEWATRHLHAKGCVSGMERVAWRAEGF